MLRRSGSKEEEWGIACRGDVTVSFHRIWEPRLAVLSFSLSLSSLFVSLHRRHSPRETGLLCLCLERSEIRGVEAAGW